MSLALWATKFCSGTHPLVNRSTIWPSKNPHNQLVIRYLYTNGELGVHSQTLVLKSVLPVRAPFKMGEPTKHFDTLRFVSKRPIPPANELDLSREEDYFYPGEPLPQESQIEMVRCIRRLYNRFRRVIIYIVLMFFFSLCIGQTNSFIDAHDD